jgi:hypothetical protein
MKTTLIKFVSRTLGAVGIPRPNTGNSAADDTARTKRVGHVALLDMDVLTKPLWAFLRFEDVIR